MTEKRKLFLFDIDGTLLSPGILPRQILNQAFTDLAGGSPDLQFSDVAGSTDPSIIYNALIKLGHKDGAIKDLSAVILERYLDEMHRQFPGSDLPFIYDDALVFLNAVQEEGHATALLSGNVEAGARIKLDRFGLLDRFSFGAFGDDSSLRSDLPEIARLRAREFLGEEFSINNLVIVGDTPSDAHAASKSGARSVIVCRRPGWEDEIQAAGADIIVSSLADSSDILNKISEF